MHGNTCRKITTKQKNKGKTQWCGRYFYCHYSRTCEQYFGCFICVRVKDSDWEVWPFFCTYFPLFHLYQSQVLIVTSLSSLSLGQFSLFWPFSKYLVLTCNDLSIKWFYLMFVTSCKDVKAVRELMHGQCVSSTLAVHSGSLKRNRNSSMHKKIRPIHNWLTPGKLWNWMAQKKPHLQKGLFWSVLFADDFVCWNHFRQVLLCSLCAPRWGSLRGLWWWWCCCPSFAAGEEKLQPLLRFGNRLCWSWIIWWSWNVYSPTKLFVPRSSISKMEKGRLSSPF